MKKFIYNIFTKFFKQKTSSFIVQLFRYGIVGGISAVCDILVVLYTSKYLSFHYIVALVLGFSVGTMVNYILSNLWVFKVELENKTKKQHVKGFIAFIIIGVIGLIFTIGIVFVLFDMYHVRLLYSKLAAIILVFLWNFLARKYLVFDRKKYSFLS